MNQPAVFILHHGTAMACVRVLTTIISVRTSEIARTQIVPDHSGNEICTVRVPHSCAQNYDAKRSKHRVPHDLTSIHFEQAVFHHLAIHAFHHINEGHQETVLRPNLQGQTAVPKRYIPSKIFISFVDCLQPYPSIPQITPFRIGNLLFPLRIEYRA